MHTITAVLALALIVIVPAPAAAQSEPTTLPIIADVNVYDYTRVGTAWTPLIIATIEEFNAVRPPTAPQLVYVTAPGDADCLDLSDEVWNLSGIVVCDTSRPEEFFVNLNPGEGWLGNAQWRGSDTTVISLNSLVPAEFSPPTMEADNTVCHEMMHAYTRIHDADDSDPLGSCVWGDLLSPGSTDIRLMQERYPEVVEEPTLLDRARGAGREAQEWGCDAMSHFDMSFLWEDTKSRTQQVRDRVSEVLPDVDIDVPDVDFGLAGIDIPEVDMPDVSLPKCKDASTANS